MPSLTIADKLVYFAHCPKAGGTSVESYLIDRHGPLEHYDPHWNRHWMRGGWREAEIPSSPQHLSWTDARSVLPRPPDHVFAVVREPVSRMISEFLYQGSKRRTGRLGRQLRRLEFSTWLRVMLQAARRDPYVYDNHFRAQSAFMPAAGVKVFRLEDGLEAVAAWLAGIEGREPGPVPRSMVSNRPRSVPRPSRQDIALIARVHAEDYRRFGYDVPDPAAAPSDRLAPARAALAAMLAPAVVRLYRRGRL